MGEDCSKHPEALRLRYPVKEGVVQDWDDMARVWGHAFVRHLNVDPKECKATAPPSPSVPLPFPSFLLKEADPPQVMLTDPPLNPTSNRERMLQTMFEVFGFQAAFVQVLPPLVLLGTSLFLRPP